MNENESGTPFEDFLRSILGDEAAAEAARALEAQGFDPANLPPEFLTLLACRRPWVSSSSS